MLYNGNILMTEDKQHAWKRIEDKWEALEAVPDELKEKETISPFNYVSLAYDNNPFHYLLKQYYFDAEEYEYRAERSGDYTYLSGCMVFACVFPTTNGRFTCVIESYGESEEDDPAPWKTVVQISACPPTAYFIAREMFYPYLTTVEETNHDEDEVDDIDMGNFIDSIRLGECARQLA